MKIPSLKWMRLSIVLFCSLQFLSCGKGRFYEQEFYERISGIKIPEHSEILESIDNGEFVTATTFEIDQSDLEELIKQYTFIQKGNEFTPFFHGKNYLMLDKPSYSQQGASDLYIHYGTKGKNSWLYIVDLKSNRLWAEIQYPDMAGD